MESWDDLILEPTESEEGKSYKSLQGTNLLKANAVHDETYDFDKHPQEESVVFDCIFFLSTYFINDAKIPQTHYFFME